MRIQLPEHFNVERMLGRLRTSSYGAAYRFVESRVVRRPLRLAQVPAVAEFDLSQEGVMRLRLVSLGGASLHPGVNKTAQLKELDRQARFLWGLDDDAGTCLGAMASDPDLAPLLRRFGTLGILRAPDVYEAMLVAVLGQQISVSAAQAIRRRLMVNMGTRIDVDDRREKGSYYFYPTAEQLIQGGEGALKQQGVSQRKAACLMEMAGRAAAGGLDGEVFATLSDEGAIRWLCSMKGVGCWTAEIVLMLGLGRPDIFAAGDLALQKAAQGLWALPERPSEKILRKMAERWTGWRSHAALYLWTSLQSGAL